MRVLLSAYACEPGAGSEPGAGWSWARQAAEQAEVWLLTRTNNRDVIERALREEDLEDRLHPVYLDLPRLATVKKKVPGGTQLYYWLWQRRAGHVARQLAATIQFDVVHHLTFAVDWLPAGVSRVSGVPFLWGPVGGSTGVPSAGWRWLGIRGVLREALRWVAVSAGRAMWGRVAASRASLILAQNRDTAQFYALLSPTILRPNIALDSKALPPPHIRRSAPSDQRIAVAAGALVPLKGYAILIDAFQWPETVGWRLHIYGEGPDRRRLERRVAAADLADRVLFQGYHPRADVLEAMRRANVFVTASLHEAAGWAVAEAMAVGTPVLALAHGGPADIVADGWGVTVPPTRRMSKKFAELLSAGLPSAPFPDSRYLTTEVGELLKRIYGELADSQGGNDVV